MSKKPDPQHKPALPRVPPTQAHIRACAGGVEAGVFEIAELGTCQGLRFAVPGGQIEIIYPLAFAPKVAEAIRESHDLAQEAAPNGKLHVPKPGIVVPGQ